MKTQFSNIRHERYVKIVSVKNRGLKMAENNCLAKYLFHQGTNFYAYDYLGCCPTHEEDGTIKYTFRVWAPNAERVELFSDYTGWDNGVSMDADAGGIWSCVLESSESLNGCAYKFLIFGKNGKSVFKGDPYAKFSRGGADGASIIYDQPSFVWTDANWLKKRKESIPITSPGYMPTPINIYEVHAGSFIRKEDDSYLSYRELADALLPYVKYMGFTHVEFLPLAEHPFDGSWGYQVGAFYAPTSRFGSPDDLKYLINKFHENGVGVILDWVPAHFPKDEWGLYEFDGCPLYEYQGSDRKESASWGTRFFDLGREEIQSFLISNALYFLREFHVDGLRVDAVASMIYLDYDKDPGSWVPNSYGGRENLEAVAFLQKLNNAIFSEFPDMLMIAEESGDFGKITVPISDGGLGFNLKWNMGWANDFYDYLHTDPYFRKDKHHALNFPIMYAFSENYVLPISHDEVVHGKLSFVNKMYGSYEDKFLQMRAALMLMMTYPGKKLMFMGTEFAQFREWDFANSLEWFMLDYPSHKAMRDYVAALNHFYLDHEELWTYDFSPEGFSWILPDEAEKNLVAFRRKSEDSELIVAINFSGASQSFVFDMEKNSTLDCIFATSYCDRNDSQINYNRETESAEISLPPFSGRIYKEIPKIIKIKI